MIFFIFCILFQFWLIFLHPLKREVVEAWFFLILLISSLITFIILLVVAFNESSNELESLQVRSKKLAEDIMLSINMEEKAELIKQKTEIEKEIESLK